MSVLTKKELIKRVAKQANFTQGDVRIIIETMIKVIEETIYAQIPISIRRFMSFTYVPTNTKHLPSKDGGGVTKIDGDGIPGIKIVPTPAVNLKRAARMGLRNNQ